MNIPLPVRVRHPATVIDAGKYRRIRKEQMKLLDNALCSAILVQIIVRKSDMGKTCGCPLGGMKTED